MRVIAGEAKGRTLVVPRGGGTRPATDRIRETLFAILEPRLEGARVLDLFAGAGTLGIEALSRGAAHATFVERTPQAIDALRRNLASTRLVDRSDVVAANVVAFLDRGHIADGYDVAFLDPPFADVSTLEAVLAHANLAAAMVPSGTVIARVLRKHSPTIPARMEVARVKQIGEEDLLFLRYRDVGGGG